MLKIRILCAESEITIHVLGNTLSDLVPQRHYSLVISFDEISNVGD